MFSVLLEKVDAGAGRDDPDLWQLIVHRFIEQPTILFLADRRQGPDVYRNRVRRRLGATRAGDR